jgi:hypothetical protein
MLTFTSISTGWSKSPCRIDDFANWQR